jgi:hypothetical protein
MAPNPKSQTHVLCNKFVTHFFHHHLREMPSLKVSLLSCQNPFCLNFNKKPFASQAAYTQHIDRNIGCYNFTVKKSHIAAPHGVSVSRCHRLYENEDVTCTTNKRPSLLQRHMVNDVVAKGELPHPGLAQYSNAHFDGSVDSDRLSLPLANDFEEGMSFSVNGEDNTDCDNPNTLTCPNTAAMDEDAGASSF